MLLAGDLGFRVAVFLCFVGVPVVFGLLIRRKWRLAGARQDEIRRLLILAQEEAVRAEFEASIGYSVPVSIPVQNLCAVCFCPTTTRCARCKSVHYCSGKCQIIHWRQGHKDECRPPPISSQIDEEHHFSVNSAKQAYIDDYAATIQNERVEVAKPNGASQASPGSNYTSYSQEFSEIDDGSVVDHPSDGRSAIPASKYPGISSSPESPASISTSDRCIDDSCSISEDDSLHSLNDLDSDENDATFVSEKNKSDLRVGNVEQSKPLSSTLMTKLEANGDTYGAVDSNGETQCPRTGPSNSRIRFSQGNSSGEPSTSFSGFWDGSLDASRIRKHARSSSVNSAGAGDVKLSDSRSTLRFSFDLSAATASSDLPSKFSKVTGNSNCATSARSEPMKKPSLLEQQQPMVYGDQTSASLCSRKSNFEVEERKNYPDSKKSGEVRPALSASKDNSEPSFVLEQSKRDRPSDNSRPPVPEKLVSLPNPSDDPSSLSTKGKSTSAVKSLKVERPHNVTSIPHQVANSPSNGAVGLKTSMLKVVDQLKVSKLSKHYPFAVGNDSVAKISQKGLFSYESFVKLYNWNKVELRPCGLINCGNSCYANVVLQCLAFTPPLTAYFLQGLHSKACSKKDWCFTCEFERLILKAKEGNSLLSPIGILSHIQKIGGNLANGREEDAHEFLRYAVDTMQSICLQDAGINDSSTAEEGTTLVGLTFGGYLRSKIKCTRCRGKSERHERIMDLTVEIEGDIETLEEALRQYTGTESLDGENKYHCGRCKSYEKAKKKLSISEAPNVLTIALKRFQSGKFGKLNKSIRFPDILNLAPYMRGASDKSPIYRLYAVVVHLDIMNAAFSGHYVCYVRNAHNKWFKADDSTVKPVDLETVLNKGAYMLLYSRCSPRAPRSIRDTMISSKAKHPLDDPTWTIGKNTSSRSRHHDPSTFPYIHPKFPEVDSSSDNSSLFSQSDEISSCTDSTRESTSMDDFSDFIFGPHFYVRHSSDSDASSSSSSSSSSPLYMRHSPHSNPDRAVGGVSILNSDTSSEEQDRKLANSSSSSRSSISISRETNSESLGWANPITDNGKSGVYLRKSSRTKAGSGNYSMV